MMTTATLRPFFSFFGSKWRIAPKYPTPMHDIIIEPFAGSAGYSLRHPYLQVRLYESDPTIASLWQYLIEVKESEILSLPMDISKGVDSLNICKDAKILIGFWLNKGVSHPCKTPSAWMRKPEYARQFWGEIIRHRIASQLARIRHWKVFNLSYEHAPNCSSVTWFIDPPYSGDAGRAYRHNVIDYNSLSAWCRSREGQIIVCENAGAEWLPFIPLMRAKAMSKVNGRNHSMEAIWMN